MASGKQLEAAVKAFVEQHADLEDAVEERMNVRAHVHAERVLEQAAELEAKIRNSPGYGEDLDLECGEAILLMFRAALLRGIAVSHFNSGNHLFERKARKELGPKALQAYERVLNFSNGDYVTANTLYQLGWLSRACGARAQALKYFRELTDRFPKDSKFTGMASLRILELEAEEERAAAPSGFRWRGRTVHASPASGMAATIGAWHWPLQCAHLSIKWIVSAFQSNADVVRDSGRTYDRFLTRVPDISTALQSMGYDVTRAAADIVDTIGPCSLLVVIHKPRSLVSHVVGLRREAGAWKAYDPAHVRSRHYDEVPIETVSSLIKNAVVALIVRPA